MTIPSLFCDYLVASDSGSPLFSGGSNRKRRRAQRSFGRCRLTSTGQSPPTKSCLFCESPLHGVRTREHIFPKWLLTFMWIAKLPVTSSRVVRAGEKFEPQDVRDAPPIARTEGRVCERCNNGWMSALESSAMSILKPFIGKSLSEVDDTANLYECRGAEALIIGRWAAKTAYMVNSASSYPLKVPQEHRTSILNGVVPPDVFVFGFPFSAEEIQWSQNTQWEFLNASEEELPSEATLEERTYKIGIRLRHLSLIVVWNGLPEWTLAVPRSWPVFVESNSFERFDDEWPPGAFMAPMIGLSHAMTQIKLKRIIQK